MRRAWRALLAIAKAFKALPTPPRRSVLFLAVTAEEKGLIGSKHYAENPIYPLEKTVAALNMDVLNLWGRTKDIVVVGLGASTLDDVLAKRRRNRAARSRPTPRLREEPIIVRTISISPSKASPRSTPIRVALHGQAG